jgi:hypothetical protein
VEARSFNRAARLWQTVRICSRATSADVVVISCCLRLWPVAARGFKDLRERAQAQETAMEATRERLEQIKDLAYKLRRRQVRRGVGMWRGRRKRGMGERAGSTEGNTSAEGMASCSKE